MNTSNNKRNIHNSGPLGILAKEGKIRKIDYYSPESIEKEFLKINNNVTQNILELDPKKCKPWRYANRSNEEYDIESLKQSIKDHKQLQAGLVREERDINNNISYEIIYGVRRHQACLELGIPFIAACMEVSDQEGIIYQNAENKWRNDISNYSNAKLYYRLLKEGIFKTEKELSKKLDLSTSSLNDLMAYAKIPEKIVEKIPSIHTLSKSMALKINQLINRSNDNEDKILLVAHELGKKITSPAKLENAINKISCENKVEHSTKVYRTKAGEKIFTFSFDHKGNPKITFTKKTLEKINIEDLCEKLRENIENHLIQSEAPDLL